MSKLSDKVNQICNQHNDDESCNGCPIKQVCGPGILRDGESIHSWAERVNAAAERVGS